jgi:dipeptidase E
MKNNKIWFVNKTYGYGWTPATWEGWLVIFLWLILFVPLTLAVEHNLPFSLIGIFFVTGLLIYICYKKGEKPHWQWGKKNQNLKLLLTSAGLANQKIKEVFLAEVGEPLKEKMVLLIAYAQNNDEQFYVDKSVEELQTLGMQKITIFNLHMPTVVTNLPKFDVIYMCGGNTFSILKKLRETGIDKLVISQVNSGALYVGVSAGSIIAGPDIKIAGHGSEGDPNDVKLVDLSGFKFTDTIIFPHYRELLKSEVESFQRLVKNPVIALTDNQALLISGGKSIIIE